MLNRIILTIASFSLLFSGSLNCQNFSEYEVKLAYIYSIVRHFNWPENQTPNNEKFVVGFYGDYDLGDLPVKMYSNRKFNGKECILSDVKTVEQGKKCDIIYILGITKFDAQQFIKQLNNKAIITIGDEINGFCEVGGLINFTSKSDKYRIELCPENVEKTGLQVSTQLISISKIIKLADEF